MENPSNAPSNPPGPGPTPDPVMPDPIGPVVLTRAQFDELQRRASAAPVAAPNGSAMAGAPAVEPQTVPPARKSFMGLLFVLVLLASFVVPGLSVLAFPLVIFGLLAAAGFFKDATATDPTKRQHPAAVLVFRILLAIGISIIMAIGGFIAFIMLLFSVGGGVGS
jgi:hypothetical protein